MSCILGNKINSGSFGDVYKIECEAPKDSIGIKKESFAVKVIKNSIYGVRCITELLILLFFNYSYLINCYQYHIDIEKCVTKILMPLATCDLKSKLLRQIQPRDLNSKSPRMKAVLWQIVCAVAFLHNNGIIHGDIKPSNILLYKNDIKLADFSLSSFQFDQERIYKEAYTESYRAPEIWDKKGYSYKADIWALGCTFHELIYNKKYFPDDGILQNKSNLQDEEFINLIKKMLEVEETIRFNIWDVMKSDFFKEYYTVFSDFKLSYPERSIFLEKDFTEYFEKSLKFYLPHIPSYVYEIITMKIFKKDIDKSYNIYLDHNYINYENQILETLKSQNLGLKILRF
jgi:serine/threonine protein kinase